MEKRLLSGFRWQNVQNEEEKVQNEEEKFKSILRGPRPSFFIVQNEEEIVHFVITPACVFAPLLLHPFGRRLGQFGERVNSLLFSRLLSLLPTEISQTVHQFNFLPK
jgi:hypothetical protein